MEVKSVKSSIKTVNSQNKNISNIKKTSGKTFESLKKIQILLKRESALKQVCKMFKIIII